MIQGVLLDMDGVLVDSEELIYLAAKQMFSEHGVQVNKEDFKPYIGTGEDSYLGNVAKKYKFPIDLTQDKVRVYTIYNELAQNQLVELPGVREFISRCKSKSLKLAIATSADETKMLTNLEAIGLEKSNFDTLVNGLEVKNKKPDPEIYLKAASQLGLNPKNCLVVEDAINGIQAGLAAGAKCLALTTSYPAEQLQNAHWICGTLSDAPEESISW